MSKNKYGTELKDTFPPILDPDAKTHHDELIIEKLLPHCRRYINYSLSKLPKPIKHAIKAIDNPVYSETEISFQLRNCHVPYEALCQADKITITKYLSVCRLEKALSNRFNSASVRLQAFNNKYNEESPILKQRADNASTTFLKVVGTILSGGTLCLFGLWKVQGRSLSQNIEKLTHSCGR